MIKKEEKWKALPLTSGFARAGVYARRHFCADFQVCSPPEHLWSPRPRKAATTLAASGGQGVRIAKRNLKSRRKSDKFAKINW